MINAAADSSGVACAIVIVLAIVAIVGGMIASSAARAKAAAAAQARREAMIYAKYGHTDEADKIINQTVWHGETAEQLADSLGPPVDVDQKMLKTKTKEIWKYAHRGGNRYGLRITVENGVVVGWDEKL